MHASFFINILRHQESDSLMLVQPGRTGESDLESQLSISVTDLNDFLSIVKISLIFHHSKFLHGFSWDSNTLPITKFFFSEYLLIYLLYQLGNFKPIKLSYRPREQKNLK